MRPTLLLISALACAAAASAAIAQPKLSQNPAAAPAGTYALDKTHASLTLKLSHMGLSGYTMRFDGLDGGYSYDPASPARSQIQFNVDPRSIDTGDPKFNTEIAEQFLDAGKYPQIVFVSTAIQPGDGVHGQVLGNLTFHGVTKPVVMNVTFNGTGKGMRGEQRMGFSGTTVIRRSDFGATNYIPLVGDEVTVLMEAEFRK